MLMLEVVWYVIYNNKYYIYHVWTKWETWQKKLCTRFLISLFSKISETFYTTAWNVNHPCWQDVTWWSNNHELWILGSFRSDAPTWYSTVHHHNCIMMMLRYDSICCPKSMIQVQGTGLYQVWWSVRPDTRMSWLCTGIIEIWYWNDLKFCDFILPDF